MKYNFDLKGKIAVITGAERGIGFEIAKGFAQSGASVAIAGMREEEFENAKCGVESEGAECICIKTDVSCEDSVKNMVKQVREHFGRIDILVNNAGISHINLLSDMTDEDWNHIIQTNLSSVFYCCRQAIPPMVSKRSGKIINISSMWGLSGASCEVAYSASKSGINGFTKALAKELAPSNVQVNAIACGVIDTSMNDQLTPEERKALEDEIPAGRYGTPKEIAQMVWNIVHAPEYMTGQIIGVDGGFL